MENDPGIGLAAPRSPARQASTIEGLSEGQSGRRARSPWAGAAAVEITKRTVCWPELEPIEAEEGAMREINEQFGRRLAGLRRLPRNQKAHALRAAREWRRQALRALKERRATRRHARHGVRQLQKPAPR